MTSSTINIIPNGPFLYILSYLKGEDLCRVAQVSYRFNTLIEQCREFLYSKEDFKTLTVKKDIVGIRWLIKHHPERKCPPPVFDWASQNGYVKIVKLLLEADKPCTIWALNRTSKNGHIEIVELLLEANKPCGAIALNWASYYGHTEIVRLLLAADKPCTTKALDLASKKGHTNIVRLLLEAGRPYSDWALNWASKYDHLEIVKLLLAANKPCYLASGNPRASYSPSKSVDLIDEEGNVLKTYSSAREASIQLEITDYYKIYNIVFGTVKIKTRYKNSFSSLQKRGEGSSNTTTALATLDYEVMAFSSSGTQEKTIVKLETWSIGDF